MENPIDGSIVWYLNDDLDLEDRRYTQIGEGEPFVFDEDKPVAEPEVENVAEPAVEKSPERDLTYIMLKPGEEPFEVYTGTPQVEEPSDPYSETPKDEDSFDTAEPEVEEQPLSNPVERPKTGEIYQEVVQREKSESEKFRVQMCGLRAECAELAEAATDLDARETYTLLEESASNLIEKLDSNGLDKVLLDTLDNKNIYQLLVDQVYVDHFGNNGDFSLERPSYVPNYRSAAAGAMKLANKVLEQIGKKPIFPNLETEDLEKRVSGQPELLRDFMRQVQVDKVYQLPTSTYS